MEDVLELYRKPYDRKYPVLCMDEASKQLLAETRVPLPAEEGQPARYDHEYERKGVCSQILFVEPLRGWRKVFVRERRTMIDWAFCLREILDVYYPNVRKLRLVLDNLNTHTGTSLYEAFQPAEARRLLERVEFHYTPKHGSWLNMAEIEIGVMTGLVGAAGGVGGFFLAKSLGVSWEMQRSFGPGFSLFAALPLLGLFGLLMVKRRWRTTWGALSGAKV